MSSRGSRGAWFFAERSALAALVVATAAPAAHAQTKIDMVDVPLAIGEQRVLSTDGVRSYSEGAPGIVDVRLTRDARQFVLVGQREGTTTLLCILSSGDERHYRITVAAPAGSSPSMVTDDPARVVARDNVRLDFYFVELSAKASDAAGVSWPSTLGGGRLTATFDLARGSFGGATAVVSDHALPEVLLLKAAGWAKILRQAAVITENGTEASFTGGGEVNVRVQGALAAELRAIPYGSTVKVLPRYDRESGRIQLSLGAEVSDLTDDGGTGAPGRTRSELHTIVNLRLGQSLMLAGLTARSRLHSRSGVPWLSEVPILGVLFGTTSSMSQGTDNVMIIVPTVVEGVSSSSRSRIQEALGAYADFEGELPETGLHGSPRRRSPGVSP